MEKIQKALKEIAETTPNEQTTVWNYLAPLREVSVLRIESSTSESRLAEALVRTMLDWLRVREMIAQELRSGKRSLESNLVSIQSGYSVGSSVISLPDVARIKGYETTSTNLENAMTSLAYVAGITGNDFETILRTLVTLPTSTLK